MIIRTLAGNEIGRCKTFDGAENIAFDHLESKGFALAAWVYDWDIEEVNQNNGYDRYRQFMTIGGVRYFELEE